MGLFLFALINRLTRKRVVVFLDRHLVIDCIILGSMDIGQEVTKQGFPLDVLHKLMVY